MIIEKSDIQTETDNDSNAKEESFSVGNVGVILKILREKMYESPIKAVVREYATNARDANREAGRGDVPIEFILPNYYDNELIIKDSGLGISPDRMFEIFIKYGNSTKRESNEFVGGFGIGSKVGFSYADQFTIITTTCEIFNGKQVNVKRKYIAYIDETEAGKMRLISTEETSEDTGTAIVIPVKKDLWHDFDDAVISQTFFWNPRPILKGRPENNIPKYPSFGKKFMEGNNWELYFKDWHDTQGSRIILDGTPYPVNVYDIIKNDYTDDDNWCKNLLNQGVALYFNTGDLTVAANRDSLHYDDKTKKCIYNKLLSIKSEITNDISSYLEKCTTYMEALSFYKEFVRKFTLSSYCFKFVPIWQGIEVTDKIPLKTRKLEVKKICKNNNRLYSDNMSVLPLNAGYVYVLNSLNKNNLKQYADALLKDGITAVYILSATDEFSLNEALDDFKTTSGFDINLIDTIDISTVKPIKPAKKASKTVDAFIFDENYYSYGSKSNSYIKPTQIDEKHGEGYYIVVEGHISHLYLDNDCKEQIKNTQLKTIYDFLSTEGELDLDIFIIRKKSLNKLGKNWKPLKKKVEDYYKSIIPNNDTSYIPSLEESSRFIFSNKFSAIQEPNLLKKYISNKNSTVLEYIKESNEIKNLLEKISSLKQISNILKIETQQSNKKSKLEELFEKFEKLYPLYRMLDSWDSYVYTYRNDNNNYPSKEEYYKHIANYINLVDDAQESLQSNKIVAA